MIDDPEIQAIGKKQRQQTLKRVCIVVAVIAVAAVTLLPSGGEVATALEADGYTAVDVSRSGLFSFRYEAQKGGASCSGSFTKVPGSTSRTGVCSQTTK